MTNNKIGRRKLKKSVKRTLLAMTLMVGGLIIFANNTVEDNASANKEEKSVQVVEEKKLSHNELWSINQELAKNHEKGFEAFYLYSDEEYAVFMRNSTKDRYFVPLEIIEESYATDLQLGDNVELVMYNWEFNFVRLMNGKSVQIQDITVYGYSNKTVTFETNDKEKIVVFNEFVEAYEINNPVIGRVMCGYFFDGSLVGVR